MKKKAATCTKTNQSAKCKKKRCISKEVGKKMSILKKEAGKSWPSKKKQAIATSLSMAGKKCGDKRVYKNLPKKKSK